MGVHMMRVRAASSGWSGGPGLNTFYFNNGHEGGASEPADADAALCVTRVQAAMTAIQGVFPTSWHCVVSPQVDVLDCANGDLVNSLSEDAPELIEGTNGAGYGPTAVMLLARLNTGVFSDGNRIQGRVFLGPTAADSDASGTPGTALTAAGAAFIEAIQDAGVSGVPQLVVWRRPRAARGGEHPLAARDGRTADVTSVVVPDKFAILRSRRD